MIIQNPSACIIPFKLFSLKKIQKLSDFCINVHPSDWRRETLRFTEKALENHLLKRKVAQV
jgi:hypothetical protein